MTYAANQKNLVSYVSYSPPQRNAIVKKVGILWRIFGAVLDAMHEFASEAGRTRNRKLRRAAGCAV